MSGFLVWKGPSWRGKGRGKGPYHLVRCSPTLDIPLSYIVSSCQMRSCFQSFQHQTSSRNDKCPDFNTKQIKAWKKTFQSFLESRIECCFSLCLHTQQQHHQMHPLHKSNMSFRSNGTEIVLGANERLGISHITCHSAADASFLRALWKQLSLILLSQQIVPGFRSVTADRPVH